MPTLFAGPPGRVLQMEEPGQQLVLPPLLDLASGDLSFQQRKSIVTRVTLSAQTNQQFAHMLGGDIYIYVFGERVGEMNISGVCMAFDCSKPGDTEHGIEKMYKFYKANRLSKRDTPIQLAIGKTVLQGYLGSFTGDVFDHKLMLMQYNLGLFLLPEED